MVRSHGRCRRGARRRAKAPCVLGGPINGHRCTADIGQFPVPTLGPGARLLFLPPDSPDLDPSGVSRRLIRSLQGTGPAGPGGEQVFAKLETLRRQAAERSVEARWRRIGTPLDTSSPTECANDPVNAGYAST